MKEGRHYVIGIGELLWDMLPDGRKLGGAPANFAYHINATGCKGDIISSVGDDKEGNELLDTLVARNLEISLIQRDTHCPTGTVSVSIDKNGNPSYIIHQNVAWDSIRFEIKLEKYLKLADAICFGSLAQRSRLSAETIMKSLKTVREDCLKIFDINLRQKFYTSEIIAESLNITDVLKINEDEIMIVADMFDLGKDEMSILINLITRFDLRLVALTKGADSSILYSKDEISIIKTPEVDVVDTVGAGDSFTAVLVAGLLQGDSLRTIHKKAVDVSAWVCTQHGATPTYTKQIEQILK